MESGMQVMSFMEMGDNWPVLSTSLIPAPEKPVFAIISNFDYNIFIQLSYFLIISGLILSHLRSSFLVDSGLRDANEQCLM